MIVRALLAGLFTVIFFCLFSGWLSLRRKFVLFKKGSGDISKVQLFIFLTLNFIWISIWVNFLLSLISVLSPIFLPNPYKDMLRDNVNSCWLFIPFLVGCYIFYQYKQYKKIKEKDEDIITSKEDVDL